MFVTTLLVYDTVSRSFAYRRAPDSPPPILLPKGKTRKPEAVPKKLQKRTLQQEFREDDGHEEMNKIGLD
jgi:hypothetical protein